MAESAGALVRGKGVYEILLLWLTGIEQLQGHSSIVS